MLFGKGKRAFSIGKPDSDVLFANYWVHRGIVTHARIPVSLG